jgi:hypothetical protein
VLDFLTAAENKFFTARRTDKTFTAAEKKELWRIIDKILAFVTVLQGKVATLEASAITDATALANANVEVARLNALVAKLEAAATPPSVPPEPIPPAQPQLAAITIKPEKASLKFGEASQFVAAGWYENVTTPHITPVKWSATGGTIDQSGRYVAGSVAGDYTIRAQSTVQGQEFRYAEATVSVLAAIVGGGPSGQPPVITADDWVRTPDVVDVDWEDCANDAAVYAKATHPDDFTSMIKLDATGGRDGGKCMRYDWPDHTSSPTQDFGIVSHFDLGTHRAEYWFEYWFKLDNSPPFSIVGTALTPQGQHPAESYKFLAMGSSLGGRYGWQFSGDGVWFLVGGHTVAEYQWTGVPAYPAICNSQWYRARGHYKLSSDDVTADGIAEYWLTLPDGTTTYHYSANVITVNTGNGGIPGDFITSFQVGSNMNQDCSQVQSNWHDDIKVWSSDPTVPD